LGRAAWAKCTAPATPSWGVDTGTRTLSREIVPVDPAGMEICGVMMTPDAQKVAYTYKRLTSDLFVVDGWR
jgi:hypothetical protein